MFFIMELVVENENLRRALQLRKEGNPEALLWLEKAVAEGDGVAFFFKAEALFAGGFFLKKDYNGAKVCYEQSAKAGCPWGMVHFGEVCDEEEERVWYAKALASNDNYACGRCFLFGLGVEKNRVKALKYLLCAAQQGNPFAQTLIGTRSLFRTDEENTFWLEKAAVYGDPNTQHSLARKFKKGEGVEKSDEKAFFWFLQWARQKHSLCFYRAACCYEFGSGCEKNLPMSALFYLEYGDASEVIVHLSSKFHDRRVRMQELFVYGKGLKKDANLRAEVGEENCANAIRIYEECTAAARKAVLCFIWICKQGKYLNRDMHRTIGKIVLASREDPFVWHVSL